MSQFQIALIVGSLRKDSLNRKLADALVRLAPPELTFKQIRIDDLPLYNQDEEADRADSVKRLKSEIRAADGLLFVTPEYNRSIPGVLKNAIDQGSRPPNENEWSGKPAGILGVSTGALGTALCQQHLRNVLSYLDVPTLRQPEAYLSMKVGLFDEDGSISRTSKKFLQVWMDHYVAWVKSYAS